MTELVRPLETRRLYQQIADKVRALIQERGYREGSRLPPERDLAQQLGVSRPSLREALIALEMEGNVEIRMGSGVYVCQRTVRRPALPVSMGESPAELMQARGALEGAVIVLACVHATAEGLARVHDSVEAMRADVVAGRDVMAHDREFHVRIAEMSGNSILASLVGTLFDERRSPLAEHMRNRLEGQPTWHEALAEHEQIYRCLAQRDPLLAESAMRSHIRAAADRWVTPLTGVSAFFDALRANPWAYPALESVHIVGIALLLGNLVALEIRVFGGAVALPVQALARLSLRIAAVGFGLAAVSGLLMFATQPSELLANRSFLIKMGLLALAGCNAALFHARGSLHKLDLTARIQMLVSTAIWLGVVVCGRWIAY